MANPKSKSRAVLVVAFLLLLVGALYAAMPVRADHIPNGPVGHWKLDEGSGLTASDSSGHGNDGVIIQNGSSPAWVSPGHKGAGSALEFDGTGAQGSASNTVNLGNDASLDQLDNYTISIWVKFEPGYVGGGGTWANLVGRTSPTSDWAWMIYVRSNGTIRPHHKNSNGTFAPLTDSATVMPVGEWVHIEQVADGSNLRLYINGVEDPNFPIPYSGTYSLPTGNVYIGQDTRESTPLATISQVKIFNQAITAPGGVRNGLTAWFKADGSVVANGSNQVEEWLDQSGSGFIDTEARAAAPAHTDTITPSNDVLLVPGSANFNPSVDFSGATHKTLKGASVSAWDSANLQIFSVASAEGAPAGNLSGIFTINGTWTSGGGVSGGGLGYLGSTESYYLDGDGCSVATASATDGFHIARGVYVSATNALGGSTWLEGVQKATGTSCGKGSTFNFFEIGGRTTGTHNSRVFNGKIPEVIVYTSALSATEAQRVDSYLAIKYGVTLDPPANLSYLASDSTTEAWDAAANTGYYNNITGIGRDDSSALNQKQSKSINPQGIVTIGHGSIETTNQDNPNNFASDLSFLMFGDNNGAVDAWIDTGIPALDTFQYKRIQRTWKVQKTGDTDPVAVSFEVDNPDADIPDPIDGYYLINLTKETVVPLIANSPYTALGIEFDDGDLFTIGTSAAEYNVQYRKTVDPVVTSITPGQTFTYTVTAENIGNVPVTGQSFTDNLSDVVDDATFENDLAWDEGTAIWNGSDEISWTGDLNVGQTATINYSFTMNDPVTGDGVLLNGIVSPGPDSNCTEDPAVDPDCFTVSPLPILSSQKTLVSPANPQAGNTVNYEFTITNDGSAAASNVAVADDLTGVLDDAVYNGDHSASSGSLSYNPVTKRLSWNGSLAANGDPGDTVTVTFSVTVNGAGNLDDAILNNALISSDCPNPAIFDSGDPDYQANCVTSTPVSAWLAQKTISPSGDVDPGDTVSYTIEVENTGAANLTGGSAPSVDDDLTDVLDDATFNNDEQATTGTPTFAAPVLNWTGDLNIGQSATITYSAVVNQADNLGNRQLVNTIAGPMNCPSTPTANPNDFNYNPDCAVLSAITVAAGSENPDASGDGGGTGAPNTGLLSKNMLPFGLALIGGAAVLAVVYRKKLLPLVRFGKK